MKKERFLSISAGVGEICFFLLQFLFFCITWWYILYHFPIPLVSKLSNILYGMAAALWITVQPFLIIGSLFLAFPSEIVKRSRLITISLFLTLYQCLTLVTEIYYINRRFSLDFWFYWNNRTQALETLQNSNFHPLVLFMSLFPIFFITIVGVNMLYIFLQKNSARVSPGIYSNFFLLSLFIMIVMGTGNNELFIIAKQSLAPPSPFAQQYNIYFENSLQGNKHLTIPKLPFKDTNNIFFIQMESVNSQLVTLTNTPNLIRIASQDGILFPQIQAAAMQTNRAQESILCPLLPTVTTNLMNLTIDQTSLICLPKIIHQYGYKTLYFQDYPLEFGETGKFMKNIGFDEIHGADIMKSEDSMLPWGYRDDIFLRRVFDYLQKIKQEKLFVYIGISSANHYPFYSNVYQKEYSSFISTIPFPSPTSFQERITDGHFIQDAIIGEMYTHFFLPTFGDNSHLFLFGDHSWPIGTHAGNTYNEQGTSQDNFSTSLAFLPAKNVAFHYPIGSVVRGLYSTAGLVGTVVEMISGENTTASTSFYSQLIGTPLKEHQCIISIQPYTDPAIVAIQYPSKYVYYTKRSEYEVYNLKDDPKEISPRQRQITRETLNYFRQTCLEEQNEDKSFGP